MSRTIRTSDSHQLLHNSLSIHISPKLLTESGPSLPLVYSMWPGLEKNHYFPAVWARFTSRMADVPMYFFFFSPQNHKISRQWDSPLPIFFHQCMWPLVSKGEPCRGYFVYKVVPAVSFVIFNLGPIILLTYLCWITKWIGILFIHGSISKFSTALSHYVTSVLQIWQTTLD